MGLFDILNTIADEIVELIDDSKKDISAKKEGVINSTIKKVQYSYLGQQRNFVDYMLKYDIYGSNIIGRFDKRYLSIGYDNRIYLNNTIPLSHNPLNNYDIEFWLFKEDKNTYSIYWYIKYGDQDKEYSGLCVSIDEKEANDIMQYLEFILEYPPEDTHSKEKNQKGFQDSIILRTCKQKNILPLKKYIDNKEFDKAFLAVQNILLDCMRHVEPSIQLTAYQDENEVERIFSKFDSVEWYARSLCSIIRDIRELGNIIDVEKNLKCAVYAACKLFNALSPSDKVSLYFEQYAKEHSWV